MGSTFMEEFKKISEPLRITNSGKYELSDYCSADEIAISGALLLEPYFENNLGTTIKIMDQKTLVEFDRFMLIAFQDPNHPSQDRINISGKFFDPKKHFLKIEPRSLSTEVHFLLYFSSDQSS